MIRRHFFQRSSHEGDRCNKRYVTSEFHIKVVSHGFPRTWWESSYAQGIRARNEVKKRWVDHSFTHSFVHPLGHTQFSISTCIFFLLFMVQVLKCFVLSSNIHTHNFFNTAFLFMYRSLLKHIRIFFVFVLLFSVHRRGFKVSLTTQIHTHNYPYSQ